MTYSGTEMNRTERKSHIVELKRTGPRENDIQLNWNEQNREEMAYG